MRSALRNSTVVNIVRNSRLAALLTRIRHAVGDDSADAQEAADTEPDESHGDTTDAATSSGLAAGSLLFALFARASAWIRGSWLYRWLTDEPDPDVIVIDLRETRIVGPILRVLDWVFAGLGTGSGSSLLAGAARRSYRLAVSRPVQLMSAGLGAVALALVALVLATGATSTTLVVVAAALAVAAALGSRVEVTWAELRETQPVELLVAAFEPPEPPTQASEDEHEPDDER